MDYLDAAHVGAIFAALGAAAVLLADRRATLFAGFGALGIAEVALIASLVEGTALDRLLRPAGVLVAIPALGAVAAFAALLVRYPAIVPPLVLAAAPFRLPLDFDPNHRFLVAVAEPGALGRLLPLYGVLAAAVLALGVRSLRDGEVAALAREVAWPVSAFLAFASLSLLWSQDLEAATNRLAFFIIPFAALVAVVGRSPFAPWLARALAGVAVALALVFALVGLWQAATHRLLFFAPNVEVANAYGPIFRVTSLFRDPSLYGRHVVLGIAVVLVAVWLRRVHVVLAAALIAAMWAGLYVSYSQSSMAALFVVTLLIAAVAGTRNVRRGVAAGAAAIAVVGAVLVAAEVRDHSVQRATSDRSRRVELAARAFAERPVAGVGLAAQPRASQELDERPAPVAKYVSHATPLTVAAELGAIGLALYVAVLAGAVWLVDRVRRDAAPLGLALGAALLALFVHSLFYSGFFEDPITWVVLGVGASFVAERAYARDAAPLFRRGQPEPRPSP